MTESRRGASTDLRDRDLSEIPEEHLTREERRELDRRFREFLAAIRDARLGRPSRGKPGSKPTKPWNPKVHSKA